MTPSTCVGTVESLAASICHALTLARSGRLRLLHAGPGGVVGPPSLHVACTLLRSMRCVGTARHADGQHAHERQRNLNHNAVVLCTSSLPYTIHIQP